MGKILKLGRLVGHETCTLLESLPANAEYVRNLNGHRGEEDDRQGKRTIDLILYGINKEYHPNNRHTDDVLIDCPPEFLECNGINNLKDFIEFEAYTADKENIYLKVKRVRRMEDMQREELIPGLDYSQFKGKEDTAENLE